MTWHPTIRGRGCDRFSPAGRAPAGSSSLPSILKAFALVSLAAFGATEVPVKDGTSGFVEDRLSATPSIAHAAYWLGVVRSGLVGFHLLCHPSP